MEAVWRKTRSSKVVLVVVALFIGVGISHLLQKEVTQSEGAVIPSLVDSDISDIHDNVQEGMRQPTKPPVYTGAAETEVRPEQDPPLSNVQAANISSAIDRVGYYAISKSAGVLGPDLVRNVVHYVWCEKNILQFQHYLSMISVITFIKPYNIIFHYANYPRSDKYWYNTWLEDIKEEYPFFILHQLSDKEAVSACGSPDSQLGWISLLLNKQGGIYVHQNTIFARFPAELRTNSISALTTVAEGFLVVKQGFLSNGLPKTTLHCVEREEFRLVYTDHLCITKKAPYYPKNAWNKEDDFSKLVNMLMYGQTEVPRPQPDKTSLVPNIGHMFLTKHKDVNFLTYLSILSQLYILKLNNVYVHGDEIPKSDYWKELEQMSNGRLVFIKRPVPDIIFKNKVKQVHHIADVFKADTLLRHGGIYTDIDAVWISRFPEWVREYDAVASYDWPRMYKSYPDYVQNGIMLGKPGAPYWKMILESMKTFKDELFGYNGLLRPYKFFERDPSSLYLYDKLQVMCWELKCHPTWDPEFRRPNASHLNMADFNWRKAHAFHWTHPTPKELLSREALLKGHGIFADIGRLILQSAGLVNSTNPLQPGGINATNSKNNN